MFSCLRATSSAHSRDRAASRTGLCTYLNCSSSDASSSSSCTVGKGTATGDEGYFALEFRRYDLRVTGVPVQTSVRSVTLLATSTKGRLDERRESRWGGLG